MLIKSKMKLVFVCSPYAGDNVIKVIRNIKFAKKCCREIIQDNKIPVAPHIYFTRFLNDKDLGDRQLGLICGRQLMLLCDEVYVYTKYGISIGMRGDISFAEHNNIKVTYINEVNY